MVARMLFALLAGALFGLGLMISGMTDTTKVQGWLDIAGDWDPTLAFVLGGAIVPMAFAWRTAKRSEAPMLGGSFPERPSMRISPGLALGSLMFGAGWALVGLCPGPAMASLSYGGTGGAVFAGAMVLGMIVAPALRRVVPDGPGGAEGARGAREAGAEGTSAQMAATVPKPAAAKSPAAPVLPKPAAGPKAPGRPETPAAPVPVLPTPKAAQTARPEPLLTATPLPITVPDVPPAPARASIIQGPVLQLPDTGPIPRKDT